MKHPIFWWQFLCRGCYFHLNPDISIPINEDPRSKENFNTIRLLDIHTSLDDFDRYRVTDCTQQSQS
jgi:hypothetical protein